MRDNATAAIELRDFVLKLADALTPPDDGSAWTEFCEWQSNLLKDYLDRPTSDIEGEELDSFDREFERVLQVLEEVKSADALGHPATLEGFGQVVRDALQAPQGHLGPTGGGVFVSSFANAAGMSFDNIWLVGMIEGAVPPAMRPDPLLPQGDLSGRGKLSPAQRRMAGERYNYLSALATAPRRTLSYPISESASRRAAHPSRWFLEQASILAQRQVHSGDLPSLAGQPWLSLTKSAEDALDGLVDGGLADLLDYQLDRLVRWKKSGNPIVLHPMAAGGNLARAVDMGRERRSRRFTQYDGNLVAAAAGSTLRAIAGASAYIPYEAGSLGYLSLPLFPGERPGAGGAGNSGGQHPHHAAGTGEAGTQDTGRFHSSEQGRRVLASPGRTMDRGG